MKKIWFFFLIILIFLTNIKTVLAEVETTENKAFMSPEEVREYMKYMDEPEEVQRAREAIFNGENKIVEQIDVSEYKDYFIDKKYSPNQKFRVADFHSDGKYILWHDCYTSFTYYKGKLVYIIKDVYINNWPTFEFYYNSIGELKYVRVGIKGNDSSYEFDKEKNYLYKCYNLKCYDKDGNIVLRSRPYIPYK